MIEKFLVGHEQKLVWPICSLDSQEFTVSQERTDGINWSFCMVQVNASWKVTEKFIGMVKIGYGLSCNGTLKLTVSEVWIDGINWFFCMLIHIHKN